MSRKTLTIILIVSIGINLGLLGFMGYTALRHTRLLSERRPLPHWLDTVEGITPEQEDRIKAIMTEGGETMDSLMNDLFQKRCDLNLLIAQQNPDLAAIDVKITEISGIQAQMEKLIVKDLIAIKGVLTPEQQQLLIDRMRRFMTSPPPGSPFSGDMGPGRGMGPGPGGIGPGGPMNRGWDRGGPDR